MSLNLSVKKGLPKQNSTELQISFQKCAEKETTNTL